MDPMLALIDHVIADRAHEDPQENFREPLTDQERAELLLDIAVKSQKDGDLQRRLDELAAAGPNGAALVAWLREHGKQKRGDLEAWLDDFKRKEAARERAKAALATPAEDAPVEHPGAPPTDTRHTRSWLRQVERYYSERPQPPEQPEIKSPAEVRAEREEEDAKRRRWRREVHRIEMENAIRRRIEELRDKPSPNWLR
jgi:hypothetical protein